MSGFLTLFNFQERHKLFYSKVGSSFIVIITQYLSLYFFFSGHPGECENLGFSGLNFLYPVIYNGFDLSCSMGVLHYTLDNSVCPRRLMTVILGQNPVVSLEKRGLVAYHVFHSALVSCQKKKALSLVLSPIVKEWKKWLLRQLLTTKSPGTL